VKTKYYSNEDFKTYPCIVESLKDQQ